MRVLCGNGHRFVDAAMRPWITCTLTNSPTRRAAAAPASSRRFYRGHIAPDDRGHKSSADFFITIRVTSLL